MEDANNKLKEASENLEYAKNKNVEAAEIEIKRLQETTLMTIKFEEEKSLVEVVKKL